MKILSLLLLSIPAFAQLQTIKMRVDDATADVKVAAVKVRDVKCPSPIDHGGSVTCTVTLTGPAPAGGYAAKLYNATCTNDNDGTPCAIQPLLSPPSGFVIAGGQTSGTFILSLP